MTNIQLREKIYKLLFDKSRVDIIRYCNEDEWPIDELVQLFQEFALECVGEDEIWEYEAWGGLKAKDLVKFENNEARKQIRQRIKEATSSTPLTIDDQLEKDVK